MQKRLLPFILLIAGLMTVALSMFAWNAPTNAAPLGEGLEWESVGPDGGTLFEITADPNDPLRLYARSLAGIHRSLDGGETWELTADHVRYFGVNPVYVDPTDSDHLLVTVGSNRALYESRDSGATWTPGARTRVDALAFDPNLSGSYCTVDEGASDGIFCTTDDGATWATLPLPNNAGPVTIVAHPETSGRLYATTYGGGFYRSDDGGTTWTRGADTNVHTVELVAPDGTLYAISSAFSGGMGVLKSSDDGDTWTPFNEGGLPASITSLVIDPHNPAQLYAAARELQLFRTTADGSAWEMAGVTPPRSDSADGNQLAIAPTSPATLYFVGNSVYASADKGDSWTTRDNGLSAFVARGLAADPENTQRLYVGDIYGNVHTSSNGGATWNSVPVSATLAMEVNHIAVAPSNPATLYIGTDREGVWRSDDYGATWMPARGGLDLKGAYIQILDLVVDPANPDNALAALDIGVIYRTTNGGVSWTLVHDGSYLIGQNMLAYAPSNPQIAWAASEGGLYYSSDGGATWALRETTGLPEADVLAVAVDPADPQRLYAGVLAPNLLYLSVDGGATWQPLTSGTPGMTPVTNIWIDPAAPETVLVSVSSPTGRFNRHGIYRSDNGGDTWTQEMSGFLYPRTLEIAGGGGRYYASTFGAGVWRAGDFSAQGHAVYMPLIARESAGGQ